MSIPPTSTWNVDRWRFKNRDQVRALTDNELIEEWRELTSAIQLFHKHQTSMTMEMFWLFAAIVAIATERQLNLNT